MGPPAYQRVAALLRSRIADGTYRPGSRMPTLTELESEWQALEGKTISRAVSYRAYRMLIDEGLVEGRFGGGYYVRSPKQVRRLAKERYLRESQYRPGDEPVTSYSHDQGVPQDDVTIDPKVFNRTEADTELAELFGVQLGTEVLERLFTFRRGGEPTQISRSCVLWSDVEGTEIASPDCEPYPGGTIEQMRVLGHTVDLVLERVRSRMPTHHESEVLKIPPATPVLAVTRRMLSGGRVVEVAADIVMSAETTELEYEIPLPGDG